MDEATSSALISRRVPWRAALLGVATAGLGQLYCGQPLRAIALHTLSIAGVFIALRGFFVPIKPWNIVAPLTTLFIIWLLVLGDAVRCAWRAPVNYRLKAYNRWYVYLLILVLVGVGQEAFIPIVKNRFMQAFKIPTSSMLPTVMRGDRLLVDKRAYLERSPVRGDLVAFRNPASRSEIFLHRVIAVSGDVLKIEDKKVYINGVALVEPYAQFQGHTSMPVRDDFPPTPSVLETQHAGLDAAWAREMANFICDDGLHVPPDFFFVMGDNRDNSWDSRFWGFVPREDILGKARVVYFSWNPDARGVRWDRIGEVLK